MKKWFEYQQKVQSEGKDCKYDWRKETNILEYIRDDVDKIIEGFYNKTIPTADMNVYINEDWINRAVSGTQGEVTKEQYLDWLEEYKELVAGHGHTYMYDMGDLEKSIKTSICEKLNLKIDATGIRIHVEEPGHYFMLHLDRNKFRKWQEHDLPYAQDAELHNAKTYIIFLSDQKAGHMAQIDGTNINWNRGDVFYIEHQTISHCTANVGFDNNFVMVVNGEPK